MDPRHAFLYPAQRRLTSALAPCSDRSVITLYCVKKQARIAEAVVASAPLEYRIMIYTTASQRYALTTSSSSRNICDQDRPHGPFTFPSWPGATRSPPQYSLQFSYFGNQVRFRIGQAWRPGVHLTLFPERLSWQGRMVIPRSFSVGKAPFLNDPTSPVSNCCGLSYTRHGVRAVPYPA